MASEDNNTQQPDAGVSSPDAVIERIADSVTKRGLGSCAVFLLESVKPLNFIGSQAMHALWPFAAMVADGRQWTELAEALEDRKTIDRLITRIEQKEGGKSKS
jgi:hypothetical protein